MQSSKSKYGILAMAALAVAAVGGSGWKLYREHQMSQDLFDKPMHTLCVGRYLIDVPAQYVLEYHHYRIDGVSIESLGLVLLDADIFVCRDYRGPTAIAHGPRR